MAARTLTNVNYNAGPKQVHVGLNAVAWDFNSGATKFGTLSDMVFLAKIPNGALITDQDVIIGAKKQDGAAYTAGLILLAVEALGTLSQLAVLIPSMTATTAAVVFTSKIPYKLSLSDDRAVKYAVLALNVTTGASETASVSIQGGIKYLTDGSQAA